MELFVVPKSKPYKTLTAHRPPSDFHWKRSPAGMDFRPHPARSPVSAYKRTALDARRSRHQLAVEAATIRGAKGYIRRDPSPSPRETNQHRTTRFATDPNDGARWIAALIPQKTSPTTVRRFSGVQQFWNIFRCVSIDDFIHFIMDAFTYNTRYYCCHIIFYDLLHFSR